MKAAVFRGEHSLSVEEVPDPTLEPGDVLLRVATASVCGTDYRILTGHKTRGVRVPSILGHEFAGRVAAIKGDRTIAIRTTTASSESADQERVSVGDRVAVAPVIACGKCDACTRGLTNVCLARVAFGYELNGGFAEFVRVPSSALLAGNLARIPDSVSFEAACSAEPLACCICADRKLVHRTIDIAFVAGCGPVGLMHIKLLKRSGVSVVIASDPRPERCEVALAVGASAVCDPTKSSPRDVVRSASGAVGADLAVIAVSRPELVPEALRTLRSGGCVLLFAGVGEAPIDLDEAHYRDLSLIGSSASATSDYTEALRMLDLREVTLDDLVGDRYSLSAVGVAIESVSHATTLKPIIDLGRME